MSVSSYLVNLPAEIISTILQYNNCQEIINFGGTCKRFYDMVNTNEVLWRDKCKTVIPSEMFSIVQQHIIGSWLDEVKLYFTLRNNLFSIVENDHHNFQPHFDLSRSIEDIQSEDIREVFKLALSNQYSFYYIVNILQIIVNDREYFSEANHVFSRICLRYLIHAYLGIKWVSEDESSKYPERIINFFMQWVNTDRLYLEETLEEQILLIVEKVKKVLQNKLPPKFQCGDPQELVERNVLEAVSSVIFGDLKMEVASNAILELLNIPVVIKNKLGNNFAVAAIYKAVARHCGVHCELVSFPNHLFLEWSFGDNPNNEVYTVDLSNGQLNPKRRCPFSQTPNVSSRYKTRPDQLLCNIISSYQFSLGISKRVTFDMYNSTLLLGFISPESHNSARMYCKFIQYLSDAKYRPLFETPINMKYLSDGYLQLMKSLILVK